MIGEFLSNFSPTHSHPRERVRFFMALIAPSFNASIGMFNSSETMFAAQTQFAPKNIPSFENSPLTEWEISEGSQIIKKWQTKEGEVFLLMGKTGHVAAQLFKSGCFLAIPNDRISGLPHYVLKDRTCSAAFLSDTYVVVQHFQGKYSININARLRGGMFSPKSWGHGTAAIAGRGPVYTAGYAMGHSRLHVAATQGWDDDVNTFVSLGDDLNRVNAKGNTPLDDAIRERNTSVEQLLMDKGAKRSNELHQK